VQFLFDPLNHLRPIRAWAGAHGAILALDPSSFVLQVTQAGKTVDMTPRFSVRTPTGLGYTYTIGDNGSFVGWLPYPAHHWPCAVDKLVFKQWCAEEGLRTPPWSSESPPAGGDFLVKARHGSFGKNITGPWGAHAPAPTAAPAEGSFFEAFKFGRSAKAWYWRDQPVAVEVLTPPHVVGDGQRSIRTLLTQARGSFDRTYPTAPAEPMLAWQGLGLDDIPATGRKVWLGFKYVTDYDLRTLLDRDVLDSLDAPIREQFLQTGPAFLRTVPDHIRDSIYTVDAVVDSQGAVWFLEMNCHPMVHPKAYRPMLDSLFPAAKP
jgi:hypothetical protein